MILEVKFRYAVDARLGRKRNHEPAVYLGKIPLEIAEADDEAAPVAIRYDKPYGEGVAEMRFFDGRLYEPYDVDDGDSHVVMPTLGFLAEQAADDRSTFFSWGHQYSTVRGPIEDDQELREHSGGDRDEVVAKVVGRVRSLLCVEGKTWRVTSEPFLHYQTDMEGGKAVGTVVVETDPGKVDTRRCFRIDHGSRIAAVAGRDRLVPELPMVEILVPEAVSLRMDERHLNHVSKCLSASMVGNLKDASRRYFDAYATLRDALVHAEAGIDDPLDDAPFHALVVAVRTAEAVELERRREADGRTRDAGVSDVERAVGRWETGLLDQEAAFVVGM